MLVRSIRSSFAASGRFFSSSSFTEDTTKAGNLNESLGRKLFRLKKSSKAPNVIEEWKKEGHPVIHSDIMSAVRGLLNHRRRPQALMILDSMVEQNVIELNRMDYAIHLGLIADERGLNSAEIYFVGIPKKMKCDITYSALLNIYVRGGNTAQAEALMEKMEKGGFLTGFQPYIHMLSLYMEIGKIDKVEEIIKEVRKRMKPYIHNYNMWLGACASKNNVEVAEMVFSEMKEAKVKPDWLTYGTLAGLYVRNNLFEKAVYPLKEMEELVFYGEHKIGDRKAYCSIIRMHGNMGKKEEVVSIWDKMKVKLGILRDQEYNTVISVLLKLDSYEKAEEIFSEWAGLLKGGKIPKIHHTTFALLRKAKGEKKLPP